jgi:hypothetical protein
LKIAARRAEYSLAENATSPFQAEPTQADIKSPLHNHDSGAAYAPPII